MCSLIFSLKSCESTMLEQGYMLLTGVNTHINLLLQYFHSIPSFKYSNRTIECYAIMFSFSANYMTTGEVHYSYICIDSVIDREIIAI